MAERERQARARKTLDARAVLSQLGAHFAVRRPTPEAGRRQLERGLRGLITL